MSVISYTDGDFTVPMAISRPRLSQPFAGDNGEYMLKQDFMINADNFSPLALNTAHYLSAFSTYFLTGESEFQNRDAGVITWTRTYCRIPSLRNDGGSMSYRYIGYQVNIGTNTYSPGRNRFARTVASRIQHDYYMVGAGGSYADQTLIPLIQEQLYYIPIGSFSISGGVGTFTPVYPDGNPLQALTGQQVDFLFNTWNQGGFSSSTSSKPSLATYQALVAAGGYIVAQASTLQRWQGNIWDRSTIYVLAQ